MRGKYKRYEENHQIIVSIAQALINGSQLAQLHICLRIFQMQHLLKMTISGTILNENPLNNAITEFPFSYYKRQ